MSVQKPRVLVGTVFIQALIDAGLVPEYCQRIVIEAQVGDIVLIHYRAAGDDRLLNVVSALAKDAEVQD